jgi:hypothetical protein
VYECVQNLSKSPTILVFNVYLFLLPQNLVVQHTQVSCPCCGLDGTELKEPNPISLRMQLGDGRLTTLRIGYAQHEMFKEEERGIRSREIELQEETT